MLTTCRKHTYWSMAGRAWHKRGSASSVGRAGEPEKEHPGAPKPCALPGKVYLFIYFRPAKFISSDFGGVGSTLCCDAHRLRSWLCGCDPLGVFEGPPQVGLWGPGSFGSSARTQQILVSG